MASTSPIPVSTEPTVAQLNARNAAVGAPITTNGEYTGPSGTSYNPTQTTLNAGFAQPPTGNAKPTAVITSQPALDHLTQIKNDVAQAKNDITAANAPKPVVQTKTNSSSTPPGNQTTEQNSSQPSAMDQISKILDSLGQDLGTEVQPSETEGATVSQDNSAIENDQNSLAQVSDSLDKLASGSMPLTPNESFLVNDVKYQTTSAMKAAQDYAKNLTAGAEAAGASGFEKYSPAMAVANIHAAINAGNAKIGAVNTRMLSSMSKLTTALQTQDYKNATALYKSIANDIKLRSSEIDKISKTVQAETKQMHADASAFAKLQINTILSSEKMNFSQKEAQIKDLISKGNLDEKTRHDVAMELKTAKTKAASDELGNDLVSAQDALNHGADPAKVRARFLSKYPTKLKQWNDYFNPSTGTTTTASTGSSLPPGVSAPTGSTGGSFWDYLTGAL